jgi:hypothetical protein
LGGGCVAEDAVGHSAWCGLSNSLQKQRKYSNRRRKGNVKSVSRAVKFWGGGVVEDAAGYSAWCGFSNGLQWQQQQPQQQQQQQQQQHCKEAILAGIGSCIEESQVAGTPSHPHTAPSSSQPSTNPQIETPRTLTAMGMPAS